MEQGGKKKKIGKGAKLPGKKAVLPVLYFLVVLLLFFLLMFIWAGRKKTTSITPFPPGGPGARPSGNSPPEVTSASVSPGKPTSATPLTAVYSGHDPDGEPITYFFRWYADGIVVQDGPASALEPGRYRKGSEVYAEIIPSDPYGTGKPFVTDKITIGNLPPSIKSISFSPPEPQVGAVITATPAGEDPDGDEITYMYQWGVNGKSVTEPQAANTFNTSGLRKKDMVYVYVTPADKETAGQPKMSDVLVLINSAPQIISAPNYNLVDGVYTYQVVAKDHDGDRVTYKLLAAPSGMTIDPSTGLIRWQVPGQVAGKQEVPIKISVDDGDGGSATQEFSLTLEQR